jgi:hypothetical protein
MSGRFELTIWTLIMKTVRLGTIKPSRDGAPSKPRRGTLVSPRAEAFEKGHVNKSQGGPEDPFDPGKYREIFSETD